MTRPLEGTLVLDFSTLLPGPMATLLLAEAGAEVLKIERPGKGEDMRAYSPPWGRFGVNFALLNRGKKSLALDLKDPAAIAQLRPLIERADVIVEQFRPGVMARLGLDYESVRKINPRIVYCAITGYGQDGPKRDVAGHDLNYIGDAGLLALSMGQLDHPTVPPALIADIAGGAYPAVMNIILALHNRTRTGEGCYLDVAMTDGLFPFMYWAMGQLAATGQPPGNGAELVTGGTARYHLFPTRDGKVVAAAPIEQKFWETFCEIIGLDSALRDDSRDPQKTLTRCAEIIRGENAETWRGKFAGKDCCCSVVATIADALKDPHFKARGLFDHTVTNAAGAHMPALPVPIASAFRADAKTPIAAPELGDGNAKYLK
jgi:crotonobetainyl-CoA:carnitine CoA-transferase CaiB-like acyl-CoA transferase